MVRLAVCLVLFVLVDIALTLVNNTQIEARNALEAHETRRKSKKKHRSTSSSSGAARSKSTEGSGDTLNLSTDSDSDSDSKSKKKRKSPKSTIERKGWRKWHRKCPPCPEDAEKKWRDPTIAWICGGYQQARRSFKSDCMMHFRNCQDGTMFVKIHDYRCANSSNIRSHGDHFFYDYKVVLTDDSSTSGTESDTTLEDSSSSSY